MVLLMAAVMQRLEAAMVARQPLCALDYADRGGMTLEEVATELRCSRERVRQVERDALWKLRAAEWEQPVLATFLR